MRNTIFVLLFIFGCAAPKRPAVIPPPEPAAEQCASHQFVACPTGEHCARLRGKLIHARACHDHAADACTAAGCVHGCDVYNDEPKEIHCAVNASSTGHMKKCAGFANWGCPENTTCELSEEAKRAHDATGTCVPKTGAAN